MLNESSTNLDISSRTTNSRSHSGRKSKRTKSKRCFEPYKIFSQMWNSLGCLEYFVLFFSFFMGFRLIFYLKDSSPEIGCPFPKHICNSFKKYLPYERNCSVRLVESLPDNLTFTTNLTIQSTYEAWSDLIDMAESKIDMAVFYWSLNGSDVSQKTFNSSWKGEDILLKLIDAGSNRNISLRVLQNAPTNYMKQAESQILKDKANAKILSVNFTELIGAGVLHTKVWVVDEKHVYIGSANMDWRSLTQVKELGVVLENCPAVARDATKILNVYEYVVQKGYVPSRWPFVMSADSSISFPFNLSQDGSNFTAFLSSSPPQLNAEYRTNDIDAIIYNINEAKKFVYVAVMDYFPVFLYSKEKKFYPLFDDALRRAAYENSVNVRVLASHWNHTREDMVYWLKSLQVVSHNNISIEVKLFVVPSYTDEQKEIPFARVNHNKYMVTDKTAYIDTSNWSGDYFTSTGGIGISVTPEGNNGSNNTLRDQLEALFERDWNSPYAHELGNFTVPS